MMDEGMWAPKSPQEIRDDVRRGWYSMTFTPWQYDLICGVSTWSEADLPQWLRRHVWKDYRRAPWRTKNEST